MTIRTVIQQTRLRVELLESRTVPALVPVGPEFQVHTNSITDGVYPSVAMSDAGDSVVVWSRRVNPGFSAFSVNGQRYNSSGNPQGSEFVASTATFGGAFPDVAMDSEGNYVIVWQCQNVDGSGLAVQGQRFGALGIALGDVFQVNTYTNDQQGSAAVAMNSSGDFVVVWVSGDTLTGIPQDGSGPGIFGQRYDSDGTPQGSEFQVNSSIQGDQSGPAVAISDSGEFVVIWGSQHLSSAPDVFAQRFGADGSPLGGEFQVNTYSTAIQYLPRVGTDASGAFVVCWMSANLTGVGQDGSGGGVFAQRYDAAGTPLGGEFQVNSTTLNTQGEPQIAVNASGDFVVAWRNGTQATSGAGSEVSARSYDSTGVPLGDDFRVNTFTTGNQNFPGLSIDASGDVIVVWQSMAQDVTGYGVYGQRFANAAPAIQTVSVGNGTAQRSRVAGLSLAFNTQVAFTGSIANAFTLTRTGGGSVNFTASPSIVNGVTVVTLNNFTGPEAQSASLRDGNYTLTALASQISANGQPMAANYTFNFFRFYGDMNGDRRVDISDFGFFSLAFLNPLNYNAALDFNNDGRIDIADFGQFSVRFFTTLP